MKKNSCWTCDARDPDVPFEGICSECGRYWKSPVELSEPIPWKPLIGFAEGEVAEELAVRSLPTDPGGPGR